MDLLLHEVPAQGPLESRQTTDVMRLDNQRDHPRLGSLFRHVEVEPTWAGWSVRVGGGRRRGGGGRRAGGRGGGGRGGGGGGGVEEVYD